MNQAESEKLLASMKMRTEQERAAIAEKILQQRPTLNAPVWIFGYGSLMWKPEVHYTQSAIGTLMGYHRKFCIWSVLNRGAPQSPGLMMGLWHGGACTGMIFQLTSATLREEIDKLVARECRWGVYTPLWLPVHTEETTVTALVFTVDATHPAIKSNLSQEQTTYYLATGEGPRGTSRDYLFNTVSQMQSVGISDGPIEQLGKQVQQYCQSNQNCLS